MEPYHAVPKPASVDLHHAFRYRTISMPAVTPDRTRWSLTRTATADTAHHEHRHPMNKPSHKDLVLVVDDDKMMRLLVRTSLEQAGFAVEEAHDGLDALAAFTRVRPAIVLLDVIMPNLDGFGACAAIRKLEGGDHVPILVMTGSNDPDSINRAYGAGADDFVTKPIAWPVLLHRVRYLLRASSAFLELSRSEARLANAQRIAQLGHWEWDPATERLSSSKETNRILGRTPRGLPDMHDAILHIVHANDRASTEDALYAAAHRQQPYKIDLRIVRPDGTTRVVHAQAETTLDQSGKLTLMQGTLQDISERRRAEEQIRHLALYDNLTGLANRLLFKEQASHAVAQVDRTGKALAMLSVDLDRFKRINDTLGHAIGDLLLKEVANRLIQSLRPTDYVTRDTLSPLDRCVARQGSDEFTVLLADLHQGQDAAKVARRILDVLSRPFNLDGNEIVVSASIGIAVYPLDGGDVDSLLKNADAAMCYAKDQGRNNYQYYNHKMNTSAFEKLILEANLRKALERDEFSLHYQPKIDVASGAIIGAEALIRWRHPDLGLISPAEFIPLAEETGLIVPIGEWALRSACAQTRKWHDAGHTWMQVAVNMSSLNFKQEHFHDMIARVIADSGLPARCLELEMTESLLMQDAEAMVNMLKRLKATGIRLSIDDFGTGYSSLSYLKRFPLDALKIDRSFVKDITTSANDATITSAIIAMARSLKLSVIAEGVETEAQASLLCEQGCQTMQGHLFSRPLPPPEFTTLLQQQPLGRARRVCAAA